MTPAPAKGKGSPEGAVPVANPPGALTPCPCTGRALAKLNQGREGADLCPSLQGNGAGQPEERWQGSGTLLQGPWALPALPRGMRKVPELLCASSETASEPTAFPGRQTT